MEDMTAFERQLAREALRDVGSVRPVDDAGIYRAITATQSPRWRFPSMFSAARSLLAAAIVALFGGFLLTAQPFDRVGDISPGAESDAQGVVASPQMTLRELVPWGSKRIYFTPPAGWPGEVAEFGIHDVAQIVTGCGVEDGDDLDDRPDPTYAAVGPTAAELTDSLANQAWWERSGPTDVMVGGYPGKRFVLINRAAPPCRQAETWMRAWRNADGTELGMFGGGFAIVVVADVDGERLVFTGGASRRGEATLPEVEAAADALIASIEIADADP